LLVAKQLSQPYEVEKKVTRHRRKRLKATNSLRENLAIIAWILMALVIGIALISVHAQVINHADKIIQIKGEILGLQNSNERLKLKIASLKSLDRIENIARTELGMVQPEESNVHYLIMENSEEQSELNSRVESAKNQGVTSKEESQTSLKAINKLVTDYVDGIDNAEASGAYMGP
jgi:cell division protein FtsL